MKRWFNIKKIFLGLIIFILLFFICSCDNNSNNSYKKIKNVSIEYLFDEELDSIDYENVRYILSENIREFPYVFIADILLEENIDDRYGVIFGNFTNGSNSINFEIFKNRHPRLYFYNDGITIDIIFDKVSIPLNKVSKIMCINDNGRFKCYVDNNLLQEVKVDNLNQFICTNNYCLGGDNRYNNTQYFKGIINNVVIYDKNYSISEVMDNCYNINNSGIVLAIDTSKYAYPSFKDLSNKYNILVDNCNWIDDIELPAKFDYSIAIVGDIQAMNYYWPNDVEKIYDSILNNSSMYKTDYCISLGDITDRDTDDEWNRARKCIDKMNGKIPYLLNRGNHDSTIKYRDFFQKTNDFYKNSLDECFDGNIENAYQRIKLQDDYYLIFCLDFGFSDRVISWVESIINLFPEDRVIITTHSYLFHDGTTLDENDLYPPTKIGGYNNGDHIWDKLIKKYPNIMMVISGHDPTDNVIVSIENGLNENSVIQMLVDPQVMDLKEPNGMICYLFFDCENNKIHLRYYSCIKDKYYKSRNQFVINYEIE